MINSDKLRRVLGFDFKFKVEVSSLNRKNSNFNLFFKNAMKQSLLFFLKSSVALVFHSHSDLFDNTLYFDNIFAKKILNTYF